MNQLYKVLLGVCMASMVSSFALAAEEAAEAAQEQAAPKAQEIEGVSFPGQKMLKEQSLSLNGVGLRRVTRFGIPIRVYVAGLYLPEKEADSDKILSSSQPKILHMQFLRRVDADSLKEAWREGVFKNCRQECDSYRAKVNEFNSMVVEMREGSTMTLQFLEDAVEVDIKGRQNRSGRVEGKAFRENLLAAFIGKSPPSEDFKSGLLGE